MNKFDITILEIFYFLSLSLAILIVMELILPGLVSAYLNLNFILILWAINGMILLFKPKNNDKIF
jgi:hypothetical protein